MQGKQLPLTLPLEANQDFENFFCSAANQELLQKLQQFVSQKMDTVLFVYGIANVGRTHLLQASCVKAQFLGYQFAYIPLGELTHSAVPAVLEGLEALDLVCIDDLEAIVGRPEWEEAMFHFHNRSRAQGQLLLYTASSSPAGLGLGLKDLVSRLKAALIYRLFELDDAEKARFLHSRASKLGMDLPSDSARYILKNAPRGMNSLVDIMGLLDKESLAEQRKLTIPFIKKIAAWETS